MLTDVLIIMTLTHMSCALETLSLCGINALVTMFHVIMTCDMRNIDVLVTMIYDVKTHILCNFNGFIRQFLRVSSMAVQTSGIDASHCTALLSPASAGDSH